MAKIRKILITNGFDYPGFIRVTEEVKRGVLNITIRKGNINYNNKTDRGYTFMSNDQLEYSTSYVPAMKWNKFSPELKRALR
jgi:putative cell wall-binding protein